MKRVEILAKKGAEWWSEVLLEKLNKNLEKISNESAFEEYLQEDFTQRAKVVSFEILLRDRLLEELKENRIVSLGCVDTPDSLIMSILEKSDLRDMRVALPKNTSMLISTKKGIMLFSNKEKKVLYS